MIIPFTPYAVWLFAVAFLLFCMAIVVWQRSALGHEPLGLCLGAGAWWSLLYALELAALDEAGKLFWFHLKHLGVTTITPWWLLFVLEYSRSPYARDRRLLLTLPGLSLLSFFLVWTNGWHHLFFRSLALVTVDGATLIQAPRGPLFYAHLAVTYGLLLGSVILFVRQSRRSRAGRHQQLFLLLALLVPWGANILYELRLGPMPALDYAPFAMATTVLAVTWVLFDLRIMQLIPLKPSMVFDAVSEGMILLDGRRTIVAINPPARAMLGAPALEAIGQPLSRVFPAAGAMLLEGAADHLEIQRRERFFELRRMPLSARFRQPGGQLLVLSDVTERKRGELEREELIRQLQAALTQSRALYRSSRAVIGLDDLPTQLQSVTDEVLVALDVPQVTMAFIGAEPGDIALIVQSCPNEGVAHAADPDLQGDPLLRRALDTAQLVVREGTPADPVLAAAPIRYRSETLGLLIVYDHDGGRVLSRSEGQMMSAMAGHAAIAISNSRLFDEVHRLAATDDLTGLYNRRALLSLAEREFQRAGQAGRPLSMLLLDVDLFKQINDSHGHTTGDEVLRGIGVLLRESVREDDLVGRYGGEEFALVLPDTPLREAIELAEELRARIATTIFPTAKGPVTTTVSLGAAERTDTFPTFLAMLERADDALYRAKGEGRNRVVPVGSAAQ